MYQHTLYYNMWSSENSRHSLKSSNPVNARLAWPSRKFSSVQFSLVQFSAISMAFSEFQKDSESQPFLKYSIASPENLTAFNVGRLGRVKIKSLLVVSRETMPAVAL